MSGNSGSQGAPTPDDQLKQADYLWKEYQYRHDLVWRLIFRFTASVVILSIIPYVEVSIAACLGRFVAIVPFLANALACFGVLVMANELELLGRIKNEYRKLQNTIFGDLHNPPVKEELSLFKTLINEVTKFISASYARKIGETYSSFNQFVLFYLIVLAALSFANTIFTYFFWIPRLPACTY